MPARPDLWESRRSNPRDHPVETVRSFFLRYRSGNGWKSGQFHQRNTKQRLDRRLTTAGSEFCVGTSDRQRMRDRPPPESALRSVNSQFECPVIEPRNARIVGVSSVPRSWNNIGRSVWSGTAIRPGSLQQERTNNGGLTDT